MEPQFVHGRLVIDLAGHQVSIDVSPYTPQGVWPVNPEPTTGGAMPADMPQVATAAAPGDRIQKLIDLLVKFGPTILALLRLLGLKANPSEIAEALKVYDAVSRHG